MSSMIYPTILFSTSLVSMVVLLVYVIPRFAQIFHDLHQAVPPLTQFLLDTGLFLKEYGWVLVLLAGAAFFGGRYLYRHPGARGGLDRVMFRLPLTRFLILHSELTRFCRTLGTMIQAGVPLLRALSLGQELLTNTVLKQAISPLYQEIKIGHSMSNFFRTRAPFPPRMGTMLRIAEEQGNLGEGLLDLGNHFEKALQRRIQRLMTLLEPAVIVVTGLVVGLMVLSMFTAIIGINDIKV
jgi:general secretion pathway protein F